MLKSILFTMLFAVGMLGEIQAQKDLPVRAVKPALAGEGIENLIRYNLPEGGSQTVSLTASHVIDENWLLLQGLDDNRPGLLGLHLLSMQEQGGGVAYEGLWRSGRRVDSLPEHYSMRFMRAQDGGDRLFLGFAMEKEHPAGYYLVGVGGDGSEVDGYVEAMRWNARAERWEAPSFQVRSALENDLRIAAEGVLYAIKRDGEWHLADGKRVAYHHVAEEGFVLDYYPEGIHELKVKGLGKLRYSVPVPGHVVFFERPDDMLKAGKAVSAAEGKRDLRMFSSNGAFEAYYLRHLDAERYEGEWENGFLGRLMGDKLER